MCAPRNLIGSSKFQPGSPRNRSKATRPSPCGWGLGTRLEGHGCDLGLCVTVCVSLLISAEWLTIPTASVLQAFESIFLKRPF